MKAAMGGGRKATLAEKRPAPPYHRPPTRPKSLYQWKQEADRLREEQIDARINAILNDRIDARVAAVLAAPKAPEKKDRLVVLGGDSAGNLLLLTLPCGATPSEIQDLVRGAEFTGASVMLYKPRLPELIERLCAKWRKD